MQIKTEKCLRGNGRALSCSFGNYRWWCKLSSAHRAIHLSSCCPPLIIFIPVRLFVFLFSLFFPCCWALQDTGSQCENRWSTGAKTAQRQGRQLLHLWNPCIWNAHRSIHPLTGEIALCSSTAASSSHQTFPCLVWMFKFQRWPFCLCHCHLTDRSTVWVHRTKMSARRTDRALSNPEFRLKLH